MQLVMRIPPKKGSKLGVWVVLDADQNLLGVYDGYDGDTYGPSRGWSGDDTDRNQAPKFKTGDPNPDWKLGDPRETRYMQLPNIWAQAVRWPGTLIFDVRLKYLQTYNTRSGSRTVFEDVENPDFTYELNVESAGQLFDSLQKDEAYLENWGDQKVFCARFMVSKKGQNWNLEVSNYQEPADDTEVSHED